MGLGEPVWLGLEVWWTNGLGHLEVGTIIIASGFNNSTGQMSNLDGFFFLII